MAGAGNLGAASTNTGPGLSGNMGSVMGAGMGGMGFGGAPDSTVSDDFGRVTNAGGTASLGQMNDLLRGGATTFPASIDNQAGGNNDMRNLVGGFYPQQPAQVRQPAPPVWKPTVAGVGNQPQMPVFNNNPMVTQSGGEGSGGAMNFQYRRGGIASLLRR